MPGATTEHHSTGIFQVSRKKKLSKRCPISVNVEERILLHMRERGVSYTKLIDVLFREALSKEGVDLSVPHKDEIYCLDGGDGGRPVTYDEYWRMQIIDPVTGNADYPAGSPYRGK